MMRLALRRTRLPTHPRPAFAASPLLALLALAKHLRLTAPLPHVCIVAVAAGRRSGVLVVNVAKIRTPLVRKGTEFYLDMGDQVYAQLESLMNKGTASRPWRK